MKRPLRDLIDDFAARAPTPAAGSAAALSLSQGAALGLKLVRVTRTPRTDAPTTETLARAEEELLRVVAEAIPKFDEDCRAVGALMAYFKAPPERRASVEALDEAMQVPLATLSLARDGLIALDQVAGIAKKALICEAGASASLMRAAAEISHWILRNNAAWLAKHADWSGLLEKAHDAKASAESSYEAVSRVVSRTLGAP